MSDAEESKSMLQLKLTSLDVGDVVLYYLLRKWMSMRSHMKLLTSCGSIDLAGSWMFYSFYRFFVTWSFCKFILNFALIVSAEFGKVKLVIALSSLKTRLDLSLLMLSYLKMAIIKNKMMKNTQVIKPKPVVHLYSVYTGIFWPFSVIKVCICCPVLYLINYNDLNTL